MKQKMILIALFTLLGTGAFAQGSSTASDPLLKKITTVSELATRIDEAIRKVDASATASRAAAKEANDALTALYKDYQAELEKQIKLNAGDQTLVAALEKELASVKEKNDPEKSTR